MLIWFRGTNWHQLIRGGNKGLRHNQPNLDISRIQLSYAEFCSLACCLSLYLAVVFLLCVCCALNTVLDGASSVQDNA